MVKKQIQKKTIKSATKSKKVVAEKKVKTFARSNNKVIAGY
jgi:hypothetical protein